MTRGTSPPPYYPWYMQVQLGAWSKPILTGFRSLILRVILLLMNDVGFFDCIVTLLHNFSIGNNLSTSPMSLCSSWFLFFRSSGFGLRYLPYVFGFLKVLKCLWHLEMKHKLCQILLLYCNSTMNLTGANKN